MYLRGLDPKRSNFNSKMICLSHLFFHLSWDLNGDDNKFVNLEIRNNKENIDDILLQMVMECPNLKRLFFDGVVNEDMNLINEICKHKRSAKVSCENNLRLTSPSYIDKPMKQVEVEAGSGLNSFTKQALI
ncbi:hypothetical protein NQ318_020879 [Aromia moschata]|uniref:FBD domain-containing protein n=1 Tax=Aromia moschata TaxID=1265417 RepID=A0AAV8XYM5_9CUCU|nr:hypothetical protein NQ318_020879 [Aromia moschata]